jgi:hypothetical protein
LELSSLGIQRLDFSSHLNPQALAECDRAGLGHPKHIALGKIARPARIQQVRIFALAGGIDSDWHKVLDIKAPRAAIPLFSVEAKHTSKREFIPQPM